MNIALALAIATATLNFAAAIAHYAISRAPGWRAARAFSLIALAAAMYSCGNVVLGIEGLPGTFYIAAVRWSYVWAHLHVLAWMPFAFGGRDAEFRAMPAAVRRLVWVHVPVAMLFALTGWQLTGRLYDLPISWAHVVYRYAVTTPVGDAYGAVLVGTLFVAYVHLWVRMLRGERRLWLLVFGFTVFMGCALVEVLVANRTLSMFSPADIGFLAVVAPTSAQMLRRFIGDARRLRALSGRLELEVREGVERLDRAHAALLEAERLAALGRLAAGVGHEINNPLTYVQLSLARVDDHLAGAGAPPDVRQSLADARDGAMRIQRVVEGLGSYTRGSGERRATDLAAVAHAALKVAHPQLRHVARLETALAPVPLVLGDEPRLVQAAVNLLANAAQALSAQSPSGCITLRTGVDAGVAAWLEVQDDGPGISESDLARLAEPYFTTRGASGGHGLGLFITRGIVEGHGGRLSFESGPGRGTRARITLPLPSQAELALAPPAPPCRPEPARPLPGGGEAAPHRATRPQLLIVDDEPLVAHLLAQLFEPDCDVTCAANGREALARLEAGACDGILCDLMMPGVSGMDLAEQVAGRDPGLRSRMIFLTGGAVTPEAQAFLARPDVTHVVKPPDFVALRTLVLERMRGAPTGA